MDLPFTSMIFLSPFSKSETRPTTTFMRSPLTRPGARPGQLYGCLSMSANAIDRGK